MRVTAQARRSGDWWAIEVPEVEGVFTQAKRLDQVEAMVADAVATMLDVPADSIEVDVQPALPHDEVMVAVTEAIDAAVKAFDAQIRASKVMKVAVKRLRVDEGLTTRDAAMLLKVSHQRVSQLEKDEHSGAATTDRARRKVTNGG